MVGASWSWCGLALLSVPALTPTLALIATNPIGIPHAERLVAVGIAAWALAASWAVFLVRRGYTWNQGTFAAFVALVVIFWGGALTSEIEGILGWLCATFLVAAITVLAGRFERDSVFIVVVVGVAVAMISGPVFALIDSLTGFSEDFVTDETHLSAHLTSTPDLWLVVLDGHPSQATMAMDFGSDSAAQFSALLESSDLVAPRRPASSYWLTDYSLPSLVNLGYPFDMPSASDATKRSLYRIVSGDNRLVSVLEENGYDTYMVESGWSGSSCSSAFDVCVPSHWLDEAMYFMLGSSVFREPLLERTGYAFTVGARRTMRWALDNAPRLRDDGRPSFAFLHVLAPHPPFHLDAQCEPVVTEARHGFAFNHAGISADDRQAYLEGQIACLGTFVFDLSKLIGPDAQLIVVSDHGTDRRDQLTTPPAAWSEEAILERMGILVASTKGGCQIPDGSVLPNVMRSVISCLADTEIQTLQPRVFIGHDVELAPHQLDVLLDPEPD